MKNILRGVVNKLAINEKDFPTLFKVTTSNMLLYSSVSMNIIYKYY